MASYGIQYDSYWHLILIRDHRMLMIHSIYYIQPNALDVVVHNVHSVLERCSKANVCGRERKKSKFQEAKNY